MPVGTGLAQLTHAEVMADLISEDIKPDRPIDLVINSQMGQHPKTSKSVTPVTIDDVSTQSICFSERPKKIRPI